MRTPEAEQAVIGGLLLAHDQRSALAGLDWVTENDFSSDRHRLLWRAIRQLVGNNGPADAVTVAEWLEANGVAELAGGAGYVLELANNTPSAANLAAYAEILVEQSKRRQLAVAGRDIATAADRGNSSAAEIAMAWHPKLLALTDNKRREAQTMREGMRELWAQIQADFESKGPRGLTTPWAAVNRFIPDMRGGELVIIGGRPGMGKSTIAVNMGQSWSLSSRRARVMMFSLEMPAAQVRSRMLACLSGVPLRSIRNPEVMEEGHWPLLTNATPVLAQARFLIDDQAGLTAEQVCARALREHMREPLSAVIVDHFHRLRFGGKDPRHAMNEASARFKDLSRDLNIPVLLVAQLNRAVEKQGNQRPVMADLRECGALEQDADWVILAYRDDYYNESSDAAGIIEAIVAKARDGETGTAKMAWRGDVSRIDELPEGWSAPVQQQKKQHGFKKKWAGES